MLAAELEYAGYRVSQAENGVEALCLIRTMKPDLIVSDVLMPVMDGFTFYKKLKEDNATAHIPVLILTAREKMEDSFRVIGADDFIPKPFKSEDLLTRVKGLLNRYEYEGKTGTDKRVLVAGDDNETIGNMSEQLKKNSCQTVMVTQGPDIISQIVLFRPHILVMDVLMGKMTSHEIINVLRQMPQGEKIPILVYSFYHLDELGSEDIRQRALSVDRAEAACMAAGATKYIGRFNETTFMEIMDKYL